MGLGRRRTAQRRPVCRRRVARPEACAVGKRSRDVDRNNARRTPADDVDACSHCRPDTALGVLD
ncbi:DUF6233 domain-containing protein [Streptomyces sp. NPDC050264]|uniref:DUF6233 domain-containing protein n=1 Tax=Streptomyces sp. NPDC050264 TaxID=3155038 RepID=UPI003411FB4F